MRHKTKQKMLIVWTLVISVILMTALLHSVQFPMMYTVQQRTDCVLASNMEKQPMMVKSTEFPVHSTAMQYPSYVSLVLETRQKYVVIPNYILADNKYEGKQTITLTTQGTFEFLHYVVELCRRWNAPLSVAVYSPGTDFDSNVAQILHMRRCKDPCVRSNVTWHFIYDINHPPSEIYLFLDERESELTDCNTLPNETSTYRKDHKLTYPINVARNVARLQARTHYVLASDIELNPSSNIVPNFLKFVRDQELLERNVYVLPVFEVEEGLEPPTKKHVLASMVLKKQAVFFHRRVCDVCHRFPGRNEWLKILPNESHLDVFTVTKRKQPWEPFYIGTNEEPLFNEQFTWEGKMNKMPQVYEMCLQNYNFSILDNAFLVHAPGIKKFSREADRWRTIYARENNKVFRKLKSALRKKYNVTYDC